MSGAEGAETVVLFGGEAEANHVAAGFERRHTGDGNVGRSGWCTRFNEGSSSGPSSAVSAPRGLSPIEGWLVDLVRENYCTTVLPQLPRRGKGEVVPISGEAYPDAHDSSEIAF